MIVWKQIVCWVDSENQSAMDVDNRRQQTQTHSKYSNSARVEWQVLYLARLEIIFVQLRVLARLKCLICYVIGNFNMWIKKKLSLLLVIVAHFDESNSRPNSTNSGNALTPMLGPLNLMDQQLSMFLCLYVSMSLCLYVSMSLCLYVSSMSL